MIPAEAVEAAAKMMAMSSAEAWSDEQWDNPRVHDAYRQPWRDEARRILEAAAPHMMAEVLEEAACAAEDPSPEDMDTYFIDQADVGRWLRDRAEAYRTPDAR